MEAANTEQLQQSAERNASPSDGLDSFVRLQRVLQITDSCPRTIRRWIEAGKFPKPVFTEGNKSLWSLAELRQWQQEKFSQRKANV